MVFEDMLKRYLSKVPQFDSRGRQYDCLRSHVRLSANCLLTTHHHNILNQLTPGGMEKLMQPVTGAYTRYYNQRHGGEGTLFAGPFRAKPINSPEQFKWRVAYVHDNHRGEGFDYRFSTHRYFLDPSSAPSWIDVEQTLAAFGGLDGYLEYIEARETRARLDRLLRGPQR